MNYLVNILSTKLSLVDSVSYLSPLPYGHLLVSFLATARGELSIQYAIWNDFHVSDAYDGSVHDEDCPRAVHKTMLK